jgi:FixJ family two-component response regulator
MNPTRPLLLVEDDPDVSASLRFWLGTEGYSVETFGSVESLMQAGFSKAEVLIIDEHLPDGSGSELVRRIHANGVAIPAIVITTNPSRALKLFCAEGGVELVEKPFLSDELITAIERARDRR